ncbi:4'-phosphopantetheinyl transferase superfamily protein [Streptomyces sp. P38-E01]|uniref:4'-phosphopantetheinyl transferase superfamily protein n=1 Tax=Streptomyces tardus TaxID=2780544 RepID=A0A949JHN6_9ACTN|nr:4'-phosphopantetheinyl transferase superfamily protein [Streptomyces tardus]MBU7598769.1 4'-phosphopantetheinyl transferase superfamily protein [Streptomyces tardus]
MDATAELVHIPTVLESLETAPAVPLPQPGEGPSLWLVDAARHSAVLDRRTAAVLDEEERARAAAFRVAGARTLYQGAHIGLRLVLGSCLGVAPEELRFTREQCPCCDKQHGRPALVGAAVHFSLSHSGTLALIALAASPVGVDVERGPRSGSVDDLAGSLHPRETAELMALPHPERVAAFGRVWARKEAYLKGIGTGLGRELNLDYVGSGPVPAPGPDGWRLADVAVEGYAAAVATAPSA